MTTRPGIGGVSRRGFFAGAAAMALAPPRRAAPLRLGWPDGLGLDPVALRPFAEAALRHPVVMMRLPSPASLRDHFDAAAVDAALLPRAAHGVAFVTGAWSGEPPEATLLLASTLPQDRPPVFARVLADRRADAVLRSLCPAAYPSPALREKVAREARPMRGLSGPCFPSSALSGPFSRKAGEGDAPATWITLAPAHLAPNVAAGLVDGALVFGPVASMPGVARVTLDAVTARAVSPRLGLALRPGLGEA